MFIVKLFFLKSTVTEGHLIFISFFLVEINVIYIISFSTQFVWVKYVLIGFLCIITLDLENAVYWICPFVKVIAKNVFLWLNNLPNQV